MMFGGRHGGLTQEVTRATKPSETLRRLLAYFRPFWVLLAATGVLVVIATVLRLAAPYLMGVAVDQFIAPGDRLRPEWLAWLLPSDVGRTAGLTRTMLVLLATYLLNWGATAGQFYLMTLAGQRVLLHMRTQIFERIQTLSLAFFDRHEAGDLMSRLVSDTDVINRVFSGGIVRLASMGLSLIGIVISMLGLNWRLAAEVSLKHRVMVAGGLNPQNVGDLIRRAEPWGVDVSSGVESAGVKTVHNIEAFIKAARQAEKETEIATG